MSKQATHDSVIYYSKEDSCWIAHSLITDQIGTGNSITESLADLMRAIQQILAIAINDRDVEVLRSAPAEIQDIAKRAKHLPGEIYEVAYKMVHGNWPQEFTVVEKENGDKEPLVTQLPEFEYALA